MIEAGAFGSSVDVSRSYFVPRGHLSFQRTEKVKFVRVVVRSPVHGNQVVVASDKSPRNTLFPIIIIFDITSYY